ncbi:MAG: protein translocase subunit SecF [Pseudomonadales bacterium]
MRDLKIDFLGIRKWTMGLSGVLLLFSIVELSMNGLNLGLDFTGGTLVEVEFEESVDPQDIRQLLASSGYENGVVQFFGTDRDLLIRMPPQASVDQALLGDQILETLQNTYPKVVLRQSNYVGPAVGDELVEDAGLAVLSALIVVMLYILFRFTKQFSAGAVISLVHDVIITLGIFAMMGWTFDLSVLAAVLAVIGYSLNDTIVVCDRIRENFRTIRRGTTEEIINTSINQTLDRTLVTSMTTLFVLLALLIAGGESIFGFAVALTMGIVIGTYSSIYIAAVVLLLMKVTREDLIVPEKENADNPMP